jgi:CBS domain-containing protein
MIKGDEPVVLTASYIKNIEVHLLPGGRKIPQKKPEHSKFPLHPAFGGYGILKKVVESEPKEYYNTLWSKSAEVPIWIGSCRYERPFDEILEAFSETKIGGARVTKGHQEALITLGDAVGLISSGRLSTNMTTAEVGSVPVTISKNELIIGAIREMVSKNIRRLFVENEERFISDRTVIDYMFSPGRLGIARDHPERWIEGTVAELGSKSPGRCRSGDLDEAAKEIGESPDDCLLTDDRRVISRWDMVVRPWRAGKLTDVEN